MGELPSKLTPVTPSEVAEAFKVAAELAELEPTPQLLGVLLAQSALETGHWSFMRCYNFGNVKASDKWIAAGGSYTFFAEKPPHAEAPVSENLPKAEADYWLKRSKPRTSGGEGPDMVIKHQRSDGRYYCLFWPKHIQTRFRAYTTLAAGAGAFLQKLTGRFKPALEPAALGDVAGYVRKLHELSYFTAGLQRYTSAVQSLYRQYLPQAQAVLLDAKLTHGQRAVDWALAQVGTAEDPLGSNKGPEVSAWLKPCQRDGYGAEFGEYLASSGANWCAAFACAAEVATRMSHDPPPVHAYRCSGLELENDAKAAGAWHDISEVLAGTWEPEEGDVVIWKSGSQAWRRHVARFIERDGADTFRAVGGNEGNQVTDRGGRKLSDPALRGFIELPRVAAPVDEEEPNWEPFQRAIELESDLWQGVVGMDAFEKLLAELDSVDPKEDGE